MSNYYKYPTSLHTEPANFISQMTAGGNWGSNKLVIIGCVLLFVTIAILFYFYYIAPMMAAKYHPNREHVPQGNDSPHKAELLFFYANWCPHCKAAKPIIDNLQAEYENKQINGYSVVFTQIDCSEETDEVTRLMNQYKVEGYPTIKLLKDGQIIEYDAKPSKETLTQFLQTVL